MTVCSEGFASKIVQLDGEAYHVPSGTTGDLMYEVDTKIGWCSCPNGRSGAFCKHQALVHQKFGGDFPNLPTIDAKGRYLLGKLALGEKCPEFEFFIGLKEKISEVVMLYTN